MNTRLDLHELLCNVLGNTHVYFQPPESIKIEYPAIVYSRDSIDNTFANNGVYKQEKIYTVTVIDDNPDSIIVDKVSSLPRCSFNRHYISDNLNHDVFKIIF